MPLQSFLPPEIEAVAIAGMEAAALQALRPPPKLSLSEWADAHFVLSAESSSEPGSWTTIPFQRGWMDAISDHRVRKVTIMKSARVGYTKTFTAAIGYCPTPNTHPATRTFPCAVRPQACRCTAL